ncbi:BatD family protein [Mucilaginibacter antarcticus]|uniref:BatD family protein n=1 Tax=Mucilaginibacter antarcticus TaxID=1855725 RepID=UPI003639EFE1
MKIKYYITILLLLFAAALFGQEVKFQASASKTTVGTGEQFQITYSINGNVEGFAPPAMADFQLLSGPNVSTYMEFDNTGNRAYNTTYSFILMAVREGSFSIGAATVAVNGKSTHQPR